MSKNASITLIVVVLLLLVGGYYYMQSKPKTVPTTPIVVQDESMEKPDSTTIVEVITQEGETLSFTYTLEPDATNTDVAQGGSVTLEETDTGTYVTVKTTGYESDVPQPAHIHSGECPDVGGVVYSLENVVDGASTTLLKGVAVSDLESQLPLAVNLHKSADESSVYTGCTDLDF